MPCMGEGMHRGRDREGDREQGSQRDIKDPHSLDLGRLCVQRKARSNRRSRRVHPGTRGKITRPMVIL
jgi:hypothetical protein